MRNEIVVGLDGSPSSKPALNWAVEQAKNVGAVLRAVHVLDWPHGLSSAGFPARANFLVVGHPHQRRRGLWTQLVARSVMKQTHCPLIIAPQDMAAPGRHRALAEWALG